MFIADEKYQIVLDGQRGDPDVMHGNRRPLQTGLGEDMREVVRGRLVGADHLHPRGVEEKHERVFVFRASDPQRNPARNSDSTTSGRQITRARC